MKNPLSRIPRSPGVYELLLELLQPFEARIGSLGLVRLGMGMYVYVGSARGPGGLYARIRRHVSRGKRVRWHVDYLTTWRWCRVPAVVYAVTEGDLEHDLAKALEGLGLEPAVKGFGCSDKPSYTHLFKCIEPLDRCVEACVKAMDSLGLEPRAIHLL